MKCMRQVSLGPSSTPTLERPSESLWRHNSERFRVLQSDEIEKKDIWGSAFGTSLSLSLPLLIVEGDRSFWPLVIRKKKPKGSLTSDSNGQPTRVNEAREWAKVEHSKSPRFLRRYPLMRCESLRLQGLKSSWSLRLEVWDSRLETASLDGCSDGEQIHGIKYKLAQTIDCHYHHLPLPSLVSSGFSLDADDTRIWSRGDIESSDVIAWERHRNPW